ncbi:MAG: hypothetical protein ACREQY_14305, partial [Candidatus Binatia bacterium]
MKRRTSALALFGILIAGAAPAAAHFAERTDSLWGFVSRSDVVIIGSVERSQRFEEKGHTTAPGAVRLEVDETLLGELPAAEVGILVEGMHQPRYASGERVLVFAERRNGVLRSLQSRSEKVAVSAAVDPAVGAVRRYVEIALEPNGQRRAERLKTLTLELLRSPVSRLNEDAVYDLNRRVEIDSRLTKPEIGALGELALSPRSALVVREGIAAKLGALLASGRREALEPLERLAAAPTNPAVRVA